MENTDVLIDVHKIEQSVNSLLAYIEHHKEEFFSAEACAREATGGGSLIYWFSISKKSFYFLSHPLFFNDLETAQASLYCYCGFLSAL
jgi:hypothetical protein